jgi:broad specificity phosphatase PhoE
MATIYLVRHADHSAPDEVLIGRTKGVGLCDSGFTQARQLALQFARRRVTLVQASPQLRARETAEPLGIMLGRAVEVSDCLDEIDYGAWTGRSFHDLADDPEWNRWNCSRSGARPPGGESMQELQRRAVAHLEEMNRQQPDGEIVMVTHAEVIRAAILHFVGLHIDSYARIAVPKASVTRVRLHAPDRSFFWGQWSSGPTSAIVGPIAGALDERRAEARPYLRLRGA